jgi:hypothetical protein
MALFAHARRGCGAQPVRRVPWGLRTGGRRRGYRTKASGRRVVRRVPCGRLAPAFCWSANSSPPCRVRGQAPTARGALCAPLSTPGMGDRLGVKVPWRKRWC